MLEVVAALAFQARLQQELVAVELVDYLVAL
jgi:hypothetical protein